MLQKDIVHYYWIPVVEPMKGFLYHCFIGVKVMLYLSTAASSPSPSKLGMKSSLFHPVPWSDQAHPAETSAQSSFTSYGQPCHDDRWMVNVLQFQF